MKKPISSKVPRRTLSSAGTEASLLTLMDGNQITDISRGEICEENHYYWRGSSGSGAKGAVIPISLPTWFNPLEIFVGEMRFRYANLNLPHHLICTLESIPGWSWHPTTKEAVIAKWSAEVEFELNEAYRDPSTNKLMAIRIKQFNALRSDWISDSSIDAATLSKLTNLKDYWWYLKSDLTGTLRLAAARMLAKAVGQDCSRLFDEDDSKIAKISRYSWLTGYLRVYHRIEILPDEYSILSEGHRFGINDEDLLSSDVASGLRKAASI
jgi:hypothetical protein